MKFFVGQCNGFVDDGLVGFRDFICGVLAIRRCHIQDETIAEAMPFFCLVLLLLVLLFQVVELLALGGILGFGVALSWQRTSTVSLTFAGKAATCLRVGRI